MAGAKLYIDVDGKRVDTGIYAINIEEAAKIGKACWPGIWRAMALPDNSMTYDDLLHNARKKAVMRLTEAEMRVLGIPEEYIKQEKIRRENVPVESDDEDDDWDD